jgi:hypothetical protein
MPENGLKIKNNKEKALIKMSAFFNVKNCPKAVFPNINPKKLKLIGF